MQPKIKRVYLPKIKLLFGLFCVLFLFIFISKFISWERRWERQTGLSPLTLINLVVNGGSRLKTSEERTNLLVLGIAGGEHAGADLTDTMLVLSLNLKLRTLNLISLPRDIWSDTLKDKINSAYYYGEIKQKGGGMILAKVESEDVVGIPIHYVLMVDFSGFKELIDLVSGVTVNVVKPFVDTQFPIIGKEEDLCAGDPKFSCRYEELEFAAGAQLMNGERALKYVRSRHSEGEEGSDFARSRRQQEVLIALKEKMISPWQWLSVTRIKKLLSAFDQMIDTDLTLGELLTIGKFVSRITPEQTYRVNLEEQLISPESWVYGRYVLIPKEDYTSLHEFIRQQLH